MVNTTPKGWRRMKRVNPSLGAHRTSARVSGAMAIMCRARSSRPRTSPGADRMGRPICQVISSAMAVVSATRASTAVEQSAARSATATSFHAAWARTARARAPAIPVSVA